jgi:hypothetical protein
MWDILKVLRLFKYIFKEVEAFVKTTRPSKDIFREVDAFFSYYKD